MWETLQKYKSDPKKILFPRLKSDKNRKKILFLIFVLYLVWNGVPCQLASTDCKTNIYSWIYKLSLSSETLRELAQAADSNYIIDMYGSTT